VNGCFWHRCPTCQPTLPKSNTEFWQRKFSLNAERDERKQRELEAVGWTVVTVWECEVRSGKALETIMAALRAT
jgi:DNA mismatch endonuclease (patch repair protein)